MHWIVQSRLRTALVVLFFICLFGVSMMLLMAGTGARGVPNPTTGATSSGPNQAGPGEGGASAPAQGSGVASLTAIIGIVAGIVSIFGTISTIVLAWRADRRTAKESDLKIAALQRQIAELQSGSRGSSLS